MRKRGERRTRGRHLWLGIDFSGNHLMWRPGCGRSNVWVAAVETENPMPRLASVRPVQALEGDGMPFERLLSYLKSSNYSAAGIDAPFSVPRSRVPGGDHSKFLQRVLNWDATGRPFPRGTTLVEDLARELSPRGAKEYRLTERAWVGKVNVRSTMWNGPRGGAPMTSACLRLLANVGRPIWPWAATGSPGLLVEAFPAAQLHSWKLPCAGYNGTGVTATQHREQILDALRQRIAIPPDLGPCLRQSADALDAVLCAFAAIGVTTGRLATMPNGTASCEGWIAVHA